MFKNLGKKNIIILVTIIGLPLLLILFLILLKGCSNKKDDYNAYENKMISSAEKYLNNKNSLPITEGGIVEVSLDDLIDSGYLAKYKGDTCTGSVYVRNNGVSVESNNGGFYNYIPKLVCNNYSTTHLIDKLMESITTSESGLYEVSDGYVFKGAKVNNYVSFFDKKYRVISIDGNGILKLIKISSEKDRVVWDEKFNSDIDRAFGKNDYSDSNIVDILDNLYLKTSDKQKQHLVASSVCYGNRSASYTAIDKTNECSKVLDNQFISLMNVYDFALASYDKDCITIGAGACRNYNYLFDTLGVTWTANGDSDNSYKVLYYAQGSIVSTKASNSKKYNIVIYLDGNELYTKGDGSFENPYIIK